MIFNSVIRVKSIGALWVLSIFITDFVFTHLFVKKYFVRGVMEALGLKRNVGNYVSVVDHSDNAFHSAFQEHRKFLISHSWAAERVYLVDYAVL